jgi:hypothetical protein
VPERKVNFSLSQRDGHKTHMTPGVSFEVRIGKGNLIGLFIADLIHYPSGNALGVYVLRLQRKGCAVKQRFHIVGVVKIRIVVSSAFFLTQN